MNTCPTLARKRLRHFEFLQDVLIDIARCIDSEAAESDTPFAFAKDKNWSMRGSLA